MNACDAEALEALVAEELEPAQAKELMSHAMSCDACRLELAALRDDKARFVARGHRVAQATHVQDRQTWDRVADEIAARAPAVSAPRRGTSPLVMAFSGLAAALCVAAGWTFYNGLYHTRRADPGAAIPVELKVQAARAPRPERVLKGELALPLAELDGSEVAVALQDAPKVRVKIAGGDVSIGTTPDERGHLHVHVEDASHADPAWELALAETEGSSLRVELRCRKQDCGQAPALALELEVPARSSVDVQTADGDIIVHDVIGALAARSVSGHVDLAGSGNVDVHTTSGEVEIDGVGGEGRVESVSGDVTFSGACAAGCSRHITTVSGDVTLDAEDENADSFTLRFDTTSGRLSGDEVKDEHARELRLGNGEGRVTVKTVSGNLAL